MWWPLNSPNAYFQNKKVKYARLGNMVTFLAAAPPMAQLIELPDDGRLQGRVTFAAMPAQI